MYASTRLRRGLFAVFLFALLVPAPVLAATSDSATRGITMSPPVAKLTLGSGLIEANQRVTLTNNTSQTFKATLKLVDFKSLNENGGLTLGQVGVPLWQYGLANWMTLPGGNTLSLAPGQTENVEVLIHNRSDLTPGGHYGALVITGQSGSGQGSNSVSFSQNLVSLMFVKKLGGEQYGLKLESFTLEKGIDLPQSASLRFKSTGNVYVIPRGYIEVTDSKGKLVQKGIINQDSTLIMQGNTQKLISLLQPVADSPETGRYKATAYYRYDGQAGYQTATVTFERGGWSLQRLMRFVVPGVIILAAAYDYRRHRRHRY
jgi:type 1 fimbria pilin